MTQCNLVDYVSVVGEYVIGKHVILKYIMHYVPFHCGLKTALLIQQNLEKNRKFEKYEHESLFYDKIKYLKFL